MNILIIHQYFRTPEEGGAMRSYYIADHLSKLGHKVKVITAYNHHQYSVKKVANFEVHYLPVYYTNHLSFWSRIHAFWLFAFYAMRLMKKLRPVDINYVISTPLTTGLVGLYGKKMFAIPYLFEVGDLWPDAPIQLGVLKNPFFVWLAYKLERKIYKNAKMTVGLSPDIKRIIESKNPGYEVGMVSNMADLKLFSDRTKDERISEELGLEGKFVISYTGTIGLANHLEYLVDVAKACSDHERVRFLVMGAGAQLEKIQMQAEGLKNISFIPPGDKKKVKRILSVSDAIYISFKKVPILSSGCPNKLFDGLAAGKLIIINFEGWVKDLVEDQECGFYHDPGRPGDFFERLKVYLDNPDHLKNSQKRASKLAAERYSVEKQMQRLDEIVERLSNLGSG